MADDPTRQFYSTHAEEYEQQTKNLQPVEFLSLFMEKLPKKGKVLDVGCAYGRDSLTLAQAGFAVTGLDYSDALLKRARALVPYATFLCQDMRDLDVPAASFDGIWAYMSLLHLQKSDAPAVLKKCHAILGTKGILALGMKVGEGEALEHDRRYVGAQKYFAYFSESELRNMLEKAGFTVEWLKIRERRPPYQDKSVVEILARQSAG